MANKVIHTYDYLLEKFNYNSKKDIKTVLKNVHYFQLLGERGVSSALSILSDISKAITCSVDGYHPLTREEFEAIYYAYICDYGLEYGSILCGKDIAEMANKAIEKILYSLGDRNECEKET